MSSVYVDRSHSTQCCIEILVLVYLTHYTRRLPGIVTIFDGEICSFEGERGILRRESFYSFINRFFHFKKKHSFLFLNKI